MVDTVITRISHRDEISEAAKLEEESWNNFDLGSL